MIFSKHLVSIIPQSPLKSVAERDKLIRRYLARHESEWRNLTGFRRCLARLRLEWRAWKHAAENVKWDDCDPHNLY